MARIEFAHGRLAEGPDFEKRRRGGVQGLGNIAFVFGFGGRAWHIKKVALSARRFHRGSLGDLYAWPRARLTPAAGLVSFYVETMAHYLVVS